MTDKIYIGLTEYATIHILLVILVTSLSVKGAKFFSLLLGTQLDVLFNEHRPK